MCSKEGSLAELARQPAGGKLVNRGMGHQTKHAQRTG